MTLTINTRPAATQPVQCNFYFKQEGPLGSVTYDGDLYPYPPLYGGDTRYLLYTSLAHTTITFDAIGQESILNPHVIPPVGVGILEYFWDFGDGVQGYGPVVTHLYKVVNPNVEVTLTVVDSRNMRFSCAKPVNLVNSAFGFIVPFKARGTRTAGPPKQELIRNVTDSAAAVEGTFKIYSPRTSEPVADKALAGDEAYFGTHLSGELSDSALAGDEVATNVRYARSATDQAAASDSARKGPLAPASLTFTGQLLWGPHRVLDTFIRANENPLSNGGKWKAFKTTSEAPPTPEAEIFNNYCQNKLTAGNAVWEASTFTNPYASLEINQKATVTAEVSPNLSLYLCLNYGSGAAPFAEASYFRVSWTASSLLPFRSVRIYEIKAAEETLLGENTEILFGATGEIVSCVAKEGKIYAGRKGSSALPWVTELALPLGGLGIPTSGKTAWSVTSESGTQKWRLNQFASGSS